MEQNFVNQPDFAIAAHTLQTAGNELAKCSNELAKCSNLPAIQEGNAILAALQALSAQVQASEVRLSAQFETLSDRILAIEHNSSARLQNSLLRLSTAQLIVLHDGENNPIEPFPGTSAEIQRLGGAQVDGVLLALKMPISGTVEQRRSRLRVLIAGPECAGSDAAVINKARKLRGGQTGQTQSTSWMAMLTKNVRRIRRKLFSRRFYPVIVFLATSSILLFYYVHHIHVPDEIVSLPQYTTYIDDPAINWKRVAHVQHALSAEDLCKAIMLFSQLKEVSSLASRVLIYPSDWRLNADRDTDTKSTEAHISRVLRYAAEEFSVLLSPSDTLREDTGLTVWRQPFSKLLAYNLTQYDRVIVLGTKSIVVNAMDDLFFLAPTPIAMPYVYWSKPAGWRLSDQIMVIQPSSTEFTKVERAIRDANPDETDIGIIYKLYNDTLVRLPQRPYHILSEEFRLRDKEHKRYLGSSKEKWHAREILRQTKLVHFFDPPIEEPWIASNTTWKKYTPRCLATAYRRFDCANRHAWFQFYNDYDNRRKNICGAGFERQ